MFDTPFRGVTDLDSKKIVDEVVGMINDGHINVDPYVLGCSSIKEMEDEYGDWKTEMARSYLEYVHNEDSFYSMSERLNYLAGVFSTYNNHNHEI